MHTARIILATVFWASSAGVLYAYLLYPALLHVLAHVFGRDPAPPALREAQWPRVSLLIAAHNEAAVIEERISNALALDYPRERLEIVIASDGSDDATVALCRAHEPAVRVLDFPQRRGKAATLNETVASVTSEVIVFSDANTMMAPGAVRNLVRWFADPRVGSVCGRLDLRDGSRNADGIYWKYETFLKLREARLGGLLGANGAIYALRRSIYTPLPPGTVVDDFLIPLLAKLRTGARIVYDARAVAHEETAPDLSCEFRRRARIGTGGLQALGLLWPLLSPRHGWTAFTFLSHKVLRWACPFLLLGSLASSLALAAEPLYRAAFIAQALFYILAGVCAALSMRRPIPRFLRIAPMFAGMNLALLVGIVRGAMGEQAAIWRRTRRSAAAIER